MIFKFITLNQVLLRKTTPILLVKTTPPISLTFWSAWASSQPQLEGRGCSRLNNVSQRFKFTQNLRIWSYLETGSLQMWFKILRWTHPGFRVGPQFNDWCPNKRTGHRDMEGIRSRERRRQRLEICCCKTGKQEPPGAGRGEGGFSAVGKLCVNCRPLPLFSLKP